MSAKIGALIFDMDGILLDSEPLHLLAWQHVLNEFGITYGAADHKNFLGRKDISMAEELVERFSLDIAPLELMQRKQSCYLQEMKAAAIPRDGLLRLLQTCVDNQISRALASSATEATVAGTLVALGLREWFDVVVSGDDVRSGKPAPDIFLLAAEKLNKEPAECVVIEDTRNGLLAAVAAGMRCVSAPCESTLHEDHSLADTRVMSLVEIPATNFWISAQLSNSVLA